MSDLTDSNADYVYAFEVATDYRTGDKLCFAACRSGLKRSDDSGVTWYNAYGTLAQRLQLPLWQLWCRLITVTNH